MCGIVGIITEDSTLDNAVVVEMLDTIAHRGPDDAGLWVSPSRNALLGSCRLAILDLSPSGHQPMVSETGDLVIVYNGEIYNHIELREELTGLGYHFRSHCDTEVLLRAIEAWGDRCLDRLNGMFAFAIWDEHRQELFAARDRFGEKPFYYYLCDNRKLFIFGSEIKALVASKLFPPHPNPSAIYRYLVHHDIDSGSDTLFQNISALRAAHALRFSIRNNSLRTWRYWDLNVEREVHFSDDRQYAEHFFDLMRDSVRIRLRADVPVGSSLSGGLDSSTVVGLIAGTDRGKRQATFSARFNDSAFDEGIYIDRMAEWTSHVESHIVYPDPAALPQEVETLTWHQDQPFYGASIYAQWNVMRLANKCGITVLLDGQGGDETLAGYHDYFGSYYVDLLKRFQLPTFASAVFHYSREHGIRSLPFIFFFMLPTWIRSKLQRQLRPPGMSVEFERRWRSVSVEPSSKFRSVLQKSLYESLTQTVLPQLLRYADRNSMAFSREVRLPFLDHRLVEFLFSISDDQKIRSATTKVIMRNAIRGIVPEEIRNRKDKVGYAPPESSWLRGPLRPWVETIFHSTDFRQRSWLEPKTVDSAWHQFLNGRNGLQTVIWRWLSLEVWARTCLRFRSKEKPRRVLPLEAVQSSFSSG
jgi:asparagine synthase (glutamine-hydrolysing)